MRIDQALNQTQAQDLGEKAKVEKNDLQEQPKLAEKTSTGSSKGDTVVISEQARNLQKTETNLKTNTTAETTTDQSVRQDRVDAVKAKVESGAYVDDELVNRTADKILNSGSLNDVVKDEIKVQGNDTGQIKLEDPVDDSEKLNEVREKIKSGFYNSTEVVDGVANNILENLMA